MGWPRRGAQVDQVLERGADGLAVVVHGGVADHAWGFQRHRRAGVEFVVEGLAQSCSAK